MKEVDIDDFSIPSDVIATSRAMDRKSKEIEKLNENFKLQVSLMSQMIDTKWIQQLPEYLLKAPMSQLLTLSTDEDNKLIVEDVNMHDDYNLGFINNEKPELEDKFM